MSKQHPPAPTASAVGPCPNVIQIVGRPGPGSLPRIIAPPDHPPEFLEHIQFEQSHPQTQVSDLGPSWPSCFISDEYDLYFFTVANRGCFDHFWLNLFPKRAGMHRSYLTLRYETTHVK